MAPYAPSVLVAAVLLVFNLLAGRSAAADDTSFKCPSNFGYFADPTNCASYYICTFGSAKPRQCGADLVYKEATKTCDEKKPGAGAGCGSLKANETSTTLSIVKPPGALPAAADAKLSPSTSAAKSFHEEIATKKESVDNKAPPAEDDNQQLPQTPKKPNVMSTAKQLTTDELSTDDYIPQRKLNHVDNMPPPRRPQKPAGDADSHRRTPSLNVGDTFRRKYASQTAARAGRPSTHATSRRPRPDFLPPIDNKLDEDASSHNRRDETADNSLLPSAAAPGPTRAPTGVRPPPNHSDRYIRPPPTRSSNRPGAPPPVPGRPPPHDLYQPNERRESTQQLFPTYKTINTTPAPPADETVSREKIEVIPVPPAREQPQQPATEQQKIEKQDFDYNRAQNQQQQPPNERPQQKSAPPTDADLPQQTTSYKSSALPPADKLSPALPHKPTKCDSTTNCFLPRCFCGGITIPSNILPDQTPQMVVISFDGAVNERNLPLYEEVFDNAIVNPNGCPIRGTFFISHEFTNYGMVRHLYEKGHGIASYSISHGHGQGFHGVGAWRNELQGEKLFLAKFASVNPDYIKGARAPLFACGGDEQFEAMEQSGFLYDSTMPVPANTRAPFWPYTLDHGMPHACVIPPCPDRPHPGVWELPLNPIYGLFGESCFSVDRCNFGSSTEQVFSIMYNNFYRNHYQTNRAPFQLALHADWLNYPPYKNGFVKFISALSSMPDVWFITGSQVIDWMRQPVNSRDSIQFQPWQCPESAATSNSTISANNDYKPPCDVVNACPLPYEKRLRYFYTCSECPKKFPWVDDAERWIADRNRAV